MSDNEDNGYDDERRPMRETKRVITIRRQEEVNEVRIEARR